jgi:hypothetical protein
MMSAGNPPKSCFQPLAAAVGPKVLPLSRGYFQVRKNGIEFQASITIPEWTEMTVELEVSGGKVCCSGVVISCRGNKYSGYQVAMVFTNLSPLSQERLTSLAFASAC